MNENLADRKPACDPFLDELTTAALEAAARAGVGGPSVDLEIDLWREMDAALGDWCSQPGTWMGPESFNWSDRLAVVTDVAYRVILTYHFDRPFIDLEVGLWKALRQVIRRHRFLPARRRVNKSDVLALT